MMTHRLFKNKTTKWKDYVSGLSQAKLMLSNSLNMIKSSFHNPVNSGELRNMTDEKWEKQEGSGMWMPENEGDELIGEITDITEGTYGKQYSIKDDKGEETLTPSHKVLQNRLIKAKAGDRVKIVFKGEEPPSIKGNNPTKMYEVSIRK